MKIVGLITEYNPFHNGHLYHIQQAKRTTGADAVIVVMSGDYVQRGDSGCHAKAFKSRNPLWNAVLPLYLNFLSAILPEAQNCLPKALSLCWTSFKL